MVSSLNKVQAIGNVTKDPEITMTPNGQKVANFSVATSRQWTNQNGGKQEQTEFHNIVIWGKLAEIVEQYVIKGQKVYLEGYLQTRSWEKEGIKKYITEIIANNLIILSKKEGSQKDSEDISLEDIPF